MSRVCIQGCVRLGPHEECLFRLSAPLASCSCASLRAQGRGASCSRCSIPAEMLNKAAGVVPVAVDPQSDVGRLLFRVEVLERDVAELRARKGMPEHAKPTLGDVRQRYAEKHDGASATPHIAALTPDCWTVSIGAAPHALGDMPETCLTCAAKRAEERITKPRDTSGCCYQKAGGCEQHRRKP